MVAARRGRPVHGRGGAAVGRALRAGGWVDVLVAGGKSSLLGEGAGGSWRLAAAAGSAEHQHAAVG